MPVMANHAGQHAERQIFALANLAGELVEVEENEHARPHLAQTFIGFAVDRGRRRSGADDGAGEPGAAQPLRCVNDRRAFLARGLFDPFDVLGKIGMAAMGQHAA